MTLTLGACVASGNLEKSQLGRQIPQDCENEAKPVALPVPRTGADARLEIARNRQAAVKANKRLDVTRECQAKQREDFGAAAQ